MKALAIFCAAGLLVGAAVGVVLWFLNRLEPTPPSSPAEVVALPVRSKERVA